MCVNNFDGSYMTASAILYHTLVDQNTSIGCDERLGSCDDV